MSGEYTPDQRSDLLHPYANECTEHFKHLGPEGLKREYNRAYSDARRWLAAELAVAERRGAVRALREAAKGLQINTWMDLFEGPLQQRIASSQSVVDWLRNRADRMEADS